MQWDETPAQRIRRLRDRAEELRVVAEWVVHMGSTRDDLLYIAAQYEALADNAERGAAREEKRTEEDEPQPAV